MPAVEERLSVVEERMEQVGVILVRMEGILLNVDQRVQTLYSLFGIVTRLL